MAAENDTITRVSGLRVGHATNEDAITGCTAVLLPETGARCVVDTRGGAPGTRETALLSEGSAAAVHAILLGGGSAFGLAAADGVMQWLAQHGIGLATAAGVIPIVPAAIIYDLAIGDRVAPTTETGWAAADAASDAPVACGSVGAGIGATVGKLHGRAFAMKGGVGSAADTVHLTSGDFAVGAIVVVNAVGDVWDVRRNGIVAGAHDARGWLSGRNESADTRGDDEPEPGTNTTIGVIATDAPISRRALVRMAISGHDGLARAIRPAHTAADGDTLFALTTATEEHALSADVLRMTTATERLMETAILRAVQEAEAGGGYAAARDLPGYL